MDPPLISIGTAFLNTARFLPAALDSLLMQDHPHWECLLWDDGSADGSSEIAAAYAARDPRIRLLGDGHRHGVSVALSRALGEARGQYIGVLDSDDVLEPDALSAMLAFMREHPNLGMAYSQYTEIDEDDQFIRLGDRFRIPYSPHRLLVDFMTHHFRLIRADAFAAVGGITAINTLPPDYDLCLRLSERFEVGHLAKPLYRYRIRRDSISQGNRLSQVKDSFEAAKCALTRRKLDTQYTLALGIRAKHVLRPKAKPDPGT